MATNDSFTVNKQGGTGVTATWLKPDGLADLEWRKRIAGDHSKMVTIEVSEAVANAVNQLAIQSLVIKMQEAGRGGLTEGKAAVQGRVDRYQYGAKVSTGATVDFGALVGGFDSENPALVEMAGTQLSLLLGQGIRVTNIPEWVPLPK